jgi:hypothetical protein
MKIVVIRGSDLIGTNLVNRLSSKKVTRSWLHMDNRRPRRHPVLLDLGKALST